jgi:hypothetical protein
MNTKTTKLAKKEFHVENHDRNLNCHGSKETMEYAKDKFQRITDEMTNNKYCYPTSRIPICECKLKEHTLSDCTRMRT